MSAAATKGTVLFDGVCNLCTGSVRFILAHEASPALRFAAIQSAAGERMMRELGLDPRDPQTLVLVQEGRAWLRSEAALRIARELRLPWRLAAAFRIVPRALRDAIYDGVARRRFGWFGRRESCMVPGPGLAARFLDDAAASRPPGPETGP